MPEDESNDDELGYYYVFDSFMSGLGWSLGFGFGLTAVGLFLFALWRLFLHGLV